jgi:formylglycine-generating enzyme required for sulfatase activity
MLTSFNNSTRRVPRLRFGPEGQKRQSVDLFLESQFSKLVRFLSIPLLVTWAVSPRATAQPQPRLALQLVAGQPTLSLSGHTGTVYSIQYATGLSPTNLWVDRTLLQAQGASNFWSDPSLTAPGQRFYRAVSVSAPADTNLVFIQPGTFTMGSPNTEAAGDLTYDETQHTVTISRGFWMEKFLVTQGDYVALVGSNPSYFRNGIGTITNELTHPVERVAWTDATNYCAIRTQQERARGLIPTNYVYRLPTESEWEYSCRAGTTTAFYLGTGLHSGQANFCGQFEYDSSIGTIVNTNGICLGITTPVGSYVANAWGLYDMIGNVDEWCQDWYGAYPAGIGVDPQGPATGSLHVLRGGYWYSPAGYCRSAYREESLPGFEPPSRLGFRVVLSLAQ